MIFAPVINALALPPDARVDQRVPKKLLLDQGVPTAADKRQIQDGIEEIHWIAALKPTNIGVPDYRDEVREYLEIAILTVSFRPAAKPTRLIELNIGLFHTPLYCCPAKTKRSAFPWFISAGHKAKRAKW